MSELPSMEPCLSVLTINMLSAKTAWQERLQSLAGEINYLRPDVVCLQEVRSLENGTKTAELLADLTGMKVAASVKSIGDSVAIITKLPFEESGGIVLGHPGEEESHNAAAHTKVTSASGRHWRIVSAYLAWGPLGAPIRHAQAQEVTAMLGGIREPEGTVRVLTGDFNAMEDEPAIRYLTGKGDGQPATLWTDAFKVAGDGEGITSGPDNPWAEKAARNVGITNPQWVPKRRIDYILIEGYAFGRPGYPVRCRVECTPRAGQVTPSDHFAVWADLWDPQVQ